MAALNLIMMGKLPFSRMLLKTDWAKLIITEWFLTLKRSYLPTLTSPSLRRPSLLKKLKKWSRTYPITNLLAQMVNLFIKKYWHIIKQDFIELCNQFYARTMDLNCINSCLISLIPKSDKSEGVNGYRPISLLNCTLKILTKLLANSLKLLFMKIIHRNQYGFVKTRTVQDCMAWALEYFHACNRSKAKLCSKLILRRLLTWSINLLCWKSLELWALGPNGVNGSECLSIATSHVILNGNPRKIIHCKRGLRKGDPLSPLLFVLLADVLQSCINHAMTMHRLSLPIASAACTEFPIIQYDDDILIIMKAVNQLLVMKSILDNFHMSTGLKVNYPKSSLIINMDPTLTQLLSELFGCKIERLPFAYLGLPPGLSRPKIQDFMPLIKRVETDSPAFQICYHMEANFSW